MHDTQTLHHSRQHLEEAGLKATHQRLVIYATLHQAHSHLSAEDVYEQLQPEQPSLSLGTVYRTLELFVEANLAKRVHSQDGRLRFDANMQPHHHLICTETAQIVDYDDSELQALLADFFQKKPIPGFEVGDFQLQITGRLLQASPSRENNPNPRES